MRECAGTHRADLCLARIWVSVESTARPVVVVGCGSIGPMPNGCRVEPDTDYGSADNVDTWLPTFLSHINAQIDQRLGGKSPVTGNLDRFNFYYTRDQGNAEGSSCGPRSTLPSDLTKDCPFADAVVVLHQSTFTDCSSTGQTVNVYSAEGPIGRSFVHESGHGLFGLADEYDGETHYFQPSSNPNVWATQEACRTDAASAGWNPNECNRFTERQGDCWKLSTIEYIMNDGTHFDNGWGELASRRITAVLDQYDGGSAPPPIAGQAVPLSSNTTHLALTLSDSGFTVDNLSRLREAPATPRLVAASDCVARLVSFGGEVLGEVEFANPRYVYGEPGHTGPTYLDSASFALNLPYFYDAGRVEIYDSAGALSSTISSSERAAWSI